ncbi:MAG TPA: hypothetical protein PKD20_02630 [Candidatus Saccharibacteria bacterium]|nr:hypothetical protein [Candidatus Saccharibacteria bacterium]
MSRSRSTSFLGQVLGTLFALLAITTFPVWLPVWVGFWQWVANAYVSLVW